MIWHYALVYLASFAVDCIPVFAPPAWMLMLFLMLKFELNPWIVVTVGTAGTVCGRLVFSAWIVPWVGSKTINKGKEADLKFLGKKLSNKGWATFAFVFIYSLLPLSTTALFTAAGLARVRKILIIPPFFAGNLIGDGIILVSGKYAIHNFSDFYKGSADPKSIALMAAGLLLVLMFLVIDWRELLEKKKIKLKWKFWK